MSLNPSLTVVVCCKSDQQGLLRTISSLQALNCKPGQVIFCLNDVTLPKESLDFKFKLVKDAGLGIYSAMNFALKHVKTELVTFMNAGDEFCGDPLVSIDKPGILRYKVIGARLNRLNRLSFHFTVLGRGYCHQAIIYMTKGLTFDENYRISADFKSIITEFGNIKLACRYSSGGVIFYKGGVSTKQYLLRDIEIQHILSRSGMTVRYCIFSLVVFFKNVLKKIF